MEDNIVYLEEEIVRRVIEAGRLQNKANQAISQGRYQDAARHMRIGFSLVRHVPSKHEVRRTLFGRALTLFKAKERTLRMSVSLSNAWPWVSIQNGYRTLEALATEFDCVDAYFEASERLPTLVLLESSS